MTRQERAAWDRRHAAGEAPGEPEPFVVEMLPLVPHGCALDVAAGRGRHALALARAGIKVAALDHSESGLRGLQAVARAENLALWPIVGDALALPLRDARFDAILNVNFLERSIFPRFRNALKIGGMLLVDTFLVDQAALGHPRDPRFLLRRHELRELLADLEILRYCEGLTVYADGTKAWRASALAVRRNR